MIDYDSYYKAYDKRRRQRSLRKAIKNKFGISLKSIRINRLDNPKMKPWARRCIINEILRHDICFKERITRPKYTSMGNFTGRVNQYQ
jgi:hypothetical protein